MKKNSIFIASFAYIASIICIILLFLCIPNEIPMHINLQENIDSLFSKWFLLISISLMILFATLSIIAKAKHTKHLSNAITINFIFLNLLIFLYYSLEKEFVIGLPYKIPLSVITFMPLSFLLIVWANVLKNIPYKSTFGIKNKYTIETEFLWTQIHFSAKDKFLIASFINFLLSIIFIFFKNIIIQLILFLLIFIIAHMLLQKESKSMYKKYLEMKARKENMKKN